VAWGRTKGVGSRFGSARRVLPWGGARGDECAVRAFRERNGAPGAGPGGLFQHAGVEAGGTPEREGGYPVVCADWEEREGVTALGRASLAEQLDMGEGGAGMDGREYRGGRTGTGDCGRNNANRRPETLRRCGRMRRAQARGDAIRWPAMSGNGAPTVGRREVRKLKTMRPLKIPVVPLQDFPPCRSAAVPERRPSPPFRCYYRNYDRPAVAVATVGFAPQDGIAPRMCETPIAVPDAAPLWAGSHFVQSVAIG